ncbi:MAG: diadenylate cyclase [Verrucomicrobiales bacterium]|jgi:diadenylate cyclase
MPKPPAARPAPTERAESSLLITYAFDYARKLAISRLLVLADLLQDRRAVDKHREDESIIWVVRGDGSDAPIDKRAGDHVVVIPKTEVGRMDQVKLGLILAVLGGAIDAGQSVICLAGAAGSKRLDMMLVANPKRDFPWFSENVFESVPKALASKEFARLLEITLKFAAEGREGKPLGAIFVLGDPAELKKYTRQLILNPLEGHPRRVRQIQKQQLLESLRELASLDGAIIVDRLGVVVSAGVYLDAPLTKKVQIESGLGARHTAAAAISAKGDAVSIAISESSGTVTVFSQGSSVLEISQPAHGAK